jgi:hypothetical protein
VADRGPDGKFLPGNRASRNGGRPRRSTEEKYLKALSDSVTLDDWRAIALRAVEQARSGDDKARTWLGNYLIGKPTEYRVIDADIESDSVSDLLAEIHSALSGGDER